MRKEDISFPGKSSRQFLPSVSKLDTRASREEGREKEAKEGRRGKEELKGKERKKVSLELEFLSP